MRLSRTVSALLLGVATTALAQQPLPQAPGQPQQPTPGPLVPNPEFTDWAKFKKGTSVTVKTVASAAEQNSETTMTVSLADVAADKVVLEIASTTKENGMEFKQPAQKVDVPKQIPLPPGVTKEQLASGKPPGTVEEGTETVKAAGAEYKAKWYKTKQDLPDGVKVEGKFWTSDDVPGRVVKSEVNTSGKFVSSNKTELVELKKP